MDNNETIRMVSFLILNKNNKLHLSQTAEQLQATMQNTLERYGVDDVDFEIKIKRIK